MERDDKVLKEERKPIGRWIKREGQTTSFPFLCTKGRRPRLKLSQVVNMFGPYGNYYVTTGVNIPLWCRILWEQQGAPSRSESQASAISGAIEKGQCKAKSITRTTRKQMLHIVLWFSSQRMTQISSSFYSCLQWKTMWTNTKISGICLQVVVVAPFFLHDNRIHE